MKAPSTTKTPSTLPAMGEVWDKRFCSSARAAIWALTRIRAAPLSASADDGRPSELKIDLDRLNGVGSGIALGHPVGSTGARLIVTMIQEMKRRGVRYGCASLCASGGPAHAFIVERM